MPSEKESKHFPSAAAAQTLRTLSPSPLGNFYLRVPIRTYARALVARASHLPRRLARRNFAAAESVRCVRDEAAEPNKTPESHIRRKHPTTTTTTLLDLHLLRPARLLPAAILHGTNGIKRGALCLRFRPLAPPSFQLAL